MSGSIRMQWNGRDIVVLRPLQPIRELHSDRTANGLRIKIPVEITVHGTNKPASRFRVVSMQLGFHAERSTGQQRYWIGEAVTTEAFDEGTATDLQRELDLVLSEPAYHFYEALREGLDPLFYIQVQGRGIHLIEHSNNVKLCADPVDFSGAGTVSYSLRAWTEMLRRLGLRESIVLEVPFPSQPPSSWEEVWAALIKAHHAFDQGGETGWKQCITECRVALEACNKLEKADTGESNYKHRSLEQRIDNMRNALFQLTPLTHHAPLLPPQGGTESRDSGGKDRPIRWTRDHALLVLSTLSSLLAVRKP